MKIFFRSVAVSATLRGVVEVLSECAKREKRGVDAPFSFEPCALRIDRRSAESMITSGATRTTPR